MATLLMVPPLYYGVEYEINPWMDRARPASPEAARRQWEALYGVLTGEVGARVLLAPPRAGLPDMVFTANAGLVAGERVILETSTACPMTGGFLKSNLVVADARPLRRRISHYHRA